MFVQWLVQKFGLIITYMAPSRADDISEDLWQLITAGHNEGDGLTLFEETLMR